MMRINNERNEYDDDLIMELVISISMDQSIALRRMDRLKLDSLYRKQARKEASKEAIFSKQRQAKGMTKSLPLSISVLNKNFVIVFLSK